MPFAALEDAEALEPRRESAATPVAAPAEQGDVSAEVVGDGEFLSADELDVPVPGGPRPAPGSPRPGESDSKRRGWGLAPVRWGGVLSGGIRQRRSDNGGETRDQLYEARLRGTSYLIQPYIALISGDFGLGLVRNQSSGAGSAAASNLSGTSITGTASLSVFPQSRFPFQASYSASDSRTDGSLVATDTQRKRLSLRQNYRPPVGRWNVSGQFDRSELTGSFGRDTVDVLGANYSIGLNQHAISANGTMSRNRSSGGTINDRAAFANYSYRASDALTLDTAATYTGQEFAGSGDNAAFRGDTRSMQLFSFASWTPLESKWRGTSNLRYFQSESNFQNASFESRSIGGGASLAYQASRNLSVFGALGATDSRSGESESLSTNQNVGFGYSGDPYNLGGFSYNWYGSGSFGNSTSSGGDSQRSATASAGHSLQRSWRTGEATSLASNVSQTYGTTRSTGAFAVESKTLTHNASLSLQSTLGDRVSGYLSVSFSDSRNMGENESTFQLLNTQLSGRWRINAYSELNSNLTWQIFRQDSSQQSFDFISTRSRSQDSSISGSLGYGHARAFGVRGMFYTADFRANTNQTSSRLSGNPDAPREHVSMDLDQRLRYRIGRLDTELQGRVAKVEGRRESLVFFRVSRHFGAF